LSGRGQAAQDALRALAKEKRTLEHELNSTRKMFVEWDTSSSDVIASTMVHAVALLKSHRLNLTRNYIVKITGATLMLSEMHL
jgi:hypothetical protein